MPRSTARLFAVLAWPSLKFGTVPCGAWAHDSTASLNMLLYCSIRFGLTGTPNQPRLLPVWR